VPRNADAAPARAEAYTDLQDVCHREATCRKLDLSEFGETRYAGNIPALGVTTAVNDAPSQDNQL
jgi:hypothetical protein